MIAVQKAGFQNSLIILLLYTLISNAQAINVRFVDIYKIEINRWHIGYLARHRDQSGNIILSISPVKPSQAQSSYSTSQTPGVSYINKMTSSFGKHFLECLTVLNIVNK